MGKKRAQRKSAGDQFDISDNDSVSSSSTTFSELTIAQQETERINSVDYTLEKCMDALYEKRGPVREKALSDLVDAFEGHLLLTFVENNCVTLLHHCISSIKKGSTKEACFASRAIGLLAITVGAGSSAHEILDESIPQLTQTLKSGSETLKKTAVLDCLAVITFIGAKDLDETEISMKIMWDLIRPKASSNVGTVNKPTAAVLTAAISAWSFLLSTISGWRINSYNWKEFISFLSTLLEKEDRSVRIAAGEAIALIFEIGRLDKVSEEEREGALDGEGSKAQGFTYVESLKGTVIKQIRNLASEAGGKGIPKKELNSQRDIFQNILAFIEFGDCPESSFKIPNKGGVLTVSTWIQTIQLNFLKRFLGSGFLKHMHENELLHEIFDFTPEQNKLSTESKKLVLSAYSQIDKERSQVRTKNRMTARARNEGHFAVDTGDY